MKTVDYFAIEVERTRWEASEQLISEIRRKVFIEEQHVPVELEVDKEDPSASHWLAFSADGQPIATARLTAGGQVGRMAVLKQYRGKNVGSALVRAIIQYAIQGDIAELALSAQKQAIPFYEQFGFISEGDFYQDADIPHKAMRLSLHLQQQRYRQQNRQRLQQPDEQNRQRHSLDSRDEFFAAAQKLVRNCHQKIRIFSDHLRPALYDNQDICNDIYHFVTSKPTTHIEILVRNIEWLKQHSHKLHEMGLRLSSHIQFRKLSDEAVTMHTEFLLADKTGILYQQEPERFVGYTVQQSPLEASELADEFDALWLQSEPDPELRRLHI